LSDFIPVLVGLDWAQSRLIPWRDPRPALWTAWHWHLLVNDMGNSQVGPLFRETSSAAVEGCSWCNGSSTSESIELFTARLWALRRVFDTRVTAEGWVLIACKNYCSTSNVYIYFYTLQYTASNPFRAFSKGSDVIWSLCGESKLGHDISTIFVHFLAHALSSRNGCNRVSSVAAVRLPCAIDTLKLTRWSRSQGISWDKVLGCRCGSHL